MSPTVTAALSDLSPTIATNSPTTMTLVCKNARQKKTQVARALAECIHILQSCTEPKIPKGLQVREIDEVCGSLQNGFRFEIISLLLTEDGRG